MSIETTSLSPKELSSLVKQLKLEEPTSFALSEWTPQEAENLKILVNSYFPKIRDIDLKKTGYKKIAFTAKEVLAIKKKLEELEIEEENLSKQLKEEKGSDGLNAEERKRLKELVSFESEEIFPGSNNEISSTEISNIKEALKKAKILGEKLVESPHFIREFYEKLVEYGKTKSGEVFGNKKERLEQVNRITDKFELASQVVTWEYLLRERTEIAEAASVVRDQEGFKNKSHTAFQSRLWKILDDFIEKNVPQEIKPFCDFLHELDVYTHNANTSSERKEQVDTIRGNVYAYLKSWQSNPNSEEAKKARVELLKECVDTCVKVGAASNLYKVVFPFTETLAQTLTQDDPFVETVVQALDALEKYKEKTQSLIGKLSTRGTRETQISEAREQFKIMINGTPEQKMAALPKLITLRDQINNEFEGKENTSELWKIIDSCIKNIQNTQNMNWAFYEAHSPDEIQNKFPSLAPENGGVLFGERVTTYSDKKVFYSKLPQAQVNYRLPDGSINPKFNVEESFNLFKTVIGTYDDNDYFIYGEFCKNFIKAVNANFLAEYQPALKAYRTLIEQIGEKHENEGQKITASRNLLRRGHQKLFLNYVKTLFLASEDGIEQKLKIINSPEYLASKALLDNESKASEKKIISDCVLNYLRSVEKGTTSVKEIWSGINSESYRTLKMLLDDDAKAAVEAYEADIRIQYNNMLAEAVVDAFDPANPMAFSRLRGKDELITMENIRGLSFSKAQQQEIKRKMQDFVDRMLKNDEEIAVYSVLDLYNKASADVPSLDNMIRNAWKAVLSEPAIKNKIILAISRLLIALLQDKGSDQRCAEVLDTLLKVYPDAKNEVCAEIIKSLRSLIKGYIKEKAYSQVSAWQESLLQNKTFNEKIDAGKEINTIIEVSKTLQKADFVDAMNKSTTEYNIVLELYKEIADFVGVKELMPLIEIHANKKISDYMSKGDYSSVLKVINFVQEIVQFKEDISLSMDGVHALIAKKVKDAIKNKMQQEDYAGIKTLFDFLQSHPSLGLGVNTPFWKAQQKVISDNIIQKASALIASSKNENYSDLNKLFKMLEENKLYGEILHKLDIKAAIMSEFRVHVQKFLAENPDKEMTEKFYNTLSNIELINVEEISKSISSYLSKRSQEKTSVENDSFTIPHSSEDQEEQIISEKKIEENKNTENGQKLLQEFQKFVEQMQIMEKDPEGMTSEFLKEMTLDFATKLGSASLEKNEDELLKDYLSILENVVSKLSEKHYCLKVVMEIFLQELKYTKKMPHISHLSGAQEFIFDKFKEMVCEVSSAKLGDEKLLENMNSIVQNLCVFVGENAQNKTAIDEHILPLIKQFISWIREGNLSPEEEAIAIERVVEKFKVFDPGQEYYQERKLARIVYPTLINYLTNERALSAAGKEQTILENLGFSGQNGVEKFKHCLTFLSSDQREKLRSTLSKRYKELSEMYHDTRVPPQASSSWHEVYGKGFFASFKQDKLPPSDTWKVLFALNDALGDNNKGEKKPYLNMDNLVLQAMNAIRKLTSIKTTRPNSELAPWFENAVNIVIAFGNPAYLDELVWRLQAMVYEHAAEQLKDKEEGFNAERATHLRSCISILHEQLPKNLTAESDYEQVNSNKKFALPALYLQQIEKSSEAFQKMLAMFYPERENKTDPKEVSKDHELKKAKRHAFYEWRSQVLAGKEVDPTSFSVLTAEEKEFCEILLGPLKGKGSTPTGGLTLENITEFSEAVEKSLRNFVILFEKHTSLEDVLKLTVLEKLPEELQKKVNHHIDELVTNISTLIPQINESNKESYASLIENKLQPFSSIPGADFAMLHLAVVASVSNEIGLNLLLKMPFQAYTDLKTKTARDVIGSYLKKVFSREEETYVNNEKIEQMLLSIVKKYPEFIGEVRNYCAKDDRFSNMNQKIEKAVLDSYGDLKKFIDKKQGRFERFDSAEVKNAKELRSKFPYPEKLDYLFYLENTANSFANEKNWEREKFNSAVTSILNDTNKRYFLNPKDGKEYYNDYALILMTKLEKQLPSDENEEVKIRKKFDDFKGIAQAAVPKLNYTSEDDTVSTSAEADSPTISGELPKVTRV